MAQYASILIPDPGNAVHATINSSAASATIVIGLSKKFTITALDASLVAVPFQLLTGIGTLTATSDADMYLPGKYTMQTGASWDSIAVFNPTSAAITVYVHTLANS